MSNPLADLERAMIDAKARWRGASGAAAGARSRLRGAVLVATKARGLWARRPREASRVRLWERAAGIVRAAQAEFDRLSAFEMEAWNNYQAAVANFASESVKEMT